MTFEKLLKEPLVFSTMDNKYYYLRTKSSNPYDEVVWRIDKKTKKISAIHLIDYFSIKDQVTTVKLR